MTGATHGAVVGLAARGLLGLLAVATLGVAVSVVPGVRPEPGFVPLWDGWFQCSGYVLTGVVAVLRLVADPRRRLLWSLVTAALVLRAFAFVWSITVLGRTPPYPSLADACWLLSGVLLVAALGLLVRDQLPRRSRTLLLDALLAGITAAAVAVAVLYPTLISLTQGGLPSAVVATNLAYPLVDLAQLVLVAGLVASSGGRLPASTTSLGAGLVVMAVVDCVFLYLVAAGLFRPGTVLTPLSLTGTGLVALAAWLPEGAPRRRPREGPAGMALPAALALVDVAVLLHGAPRPTSALGPLLAAAGVSVAVLRGWTTLVGDRQHADEEIAAKQQELERFRALIETSSDFIAIAEPGGRLVYLNPAGRRMVGLPEDVDVTTVTVPELLPPTSRSAWEQIRFPALLRAGRWRGESALLDRGTGEAVPVASSSFVIRDPASGEGVLLGTVQRDVTGQKAAELDLLRFGALVDATRDFIALAGVDGQVQYVNPAGRAMVGLDPDADVTTTTIADYLTEEGLKASIEVERPAVVAHGHWEGESTLRDLRGGPPTPVAISSFLIRHPDTGEPWLLATVQRDISERIAAEAAMRDLADQRQVLLGHLVEAQEAERARIAADVHDDSVQALAAVELRLSLLQRELAGHGPELLSTVETLRGTVRGATDRLRHLLFDLESPAQRTDLRTALADAAAYLFDDDGVTWRVEGDRGAEVAEGTRVTAYRIAKEAMTNVRKHAGARHVSVGVTALDGGVEVSVVDDGRGFDPALVADRPGHLGLPGMVDRAAVAGGTVEVLSAPGGGTTVTVRLPGAPGIPADGDHGASGR